MKKTFVSVAVLAALLSATAAQAGDLNYVGAAVGVNNRDHFIPGAAAATAFGTGIPGATYTDSSREYNVTVRAGKAWDMHVHGYANLLGAGVQADLIAINGTLVALPQATLHFGDVTEPRVILHGGFAAKTGFAGGVDATYPINIGAGYTTNLRAGVTMFNKSVEGAKALAQIGFERSF